MADALQHNEWSGKTGGLPWMQRSLIVMFRVLPLWLPYGVMALVVPFYMIFNGKGRKAMYQFFRKRIGYGRWKSFWHVYANHFRFGQIILDRFCVYAGKKYHFVSEGQELMDELEKHSEGFVNLSSHVGNYEIAGYSLKPKAKRFNALVFAGETDTVMENRQRLLSQNNMRLILVKEDLSHLFELNAAIDNGEIVSMPADRIFGSQKAVECQYFGEKARFPLGAFALAAQKNVSVLTVFVMKDGYKNYHAYVREIQCDREASIRTQMSQLAQSFASNLEEIVRKYPTQWFNYFDFWKQ
ncbi:MAG: lysophospholipid acyltransferase family protein [Bacteroidales bacterium]|nr:lysophospholipid acyltransferase family protein [Bacteroidales bacterium]